MNTNIDASSPRILAAQLLRYGPRSYDEVMRTVSPDQVALVERAIADGDVIHVAGMVRLVQGRPARPAPIKDGTSEDRASSDSLPRDPAPVHDVADAAQSNAQTAESRSKKREIAVAVEGGAISREDVSDVTGLPPVVVDVIVSAMREGRQIEERDSHLSLTPWGRVTLATAAAERAILLSIAAGARGEIRIKRLETEARPGIVDALERLATLGVVAKNRRYYEIRDPALTISAGTDGVPSADALLAMVEEG